MPQKFYEINPINKDTDNWDFVDHDIERIEKCIKIGNCFDNPELLQK